MADLTTSFMGLELANPIIVGSCELTGSVEGIVHAAEAGAGAVVLKSFFEEQFAGEVSPEERGRFVSPEAIDYLERGGLLEYATQNTARMIEEAKKEVNVPIIASVNCRSPHLWPRFARHFEEAGADGLELNIYFLPFDPQTPGSEYENSHIEIMEEVRKSVSIPVSVKLSSGLTALPHLSKKLAEAGCQAVVYFNWFLQPDINISNLETRTIIGKGDLHQTLRWVALCAGRVGCDIASSGGVRRADDIIKLILAGASAVQVASLFLTQGLAALPGLLDGLQAWMDEHGYQSLEDFRGELSWKRQQLSFHEPRDAEAFFRSQYIKIYRSKFRV
ncbi:MAG: dihydroorotate dehydrogenase-like protein [Clostridiales bacterium]|nr:dihydroorotate dehydrogenase-like protein [Clostridiales bacterium]